MDSECFENKRKPFVEPQNECTDVSPVEEYEVSKVVGKEVDELQRPQLQQED
jgi:hypothetical protein